MTDKVCSEKNVTNKIGKQEIRSVVMTCKHQLLGKTKVFIHVSQILKSQVKQKLGNVAFFSCQHIFYQFFNDFHFAKIPYSSAAFL